MTTGQRIKARRKQVEMSADTLAEKLGISRSTVFRYENGDIEKMPIDIIKPIATALNTSVDYLMGWEEDPNSKYLQGTTPVTSESEKIEFANRLFAAAGNVAPSDYSEKAVADIGDYMRFVAEKERQKNEDK